MTGMGPNDVPCVVWAIGEFFLQFLSCFIYILTNVCSLPTKYATGRPRTGPNDARRVVWAILGEFFLNHFFMFL